MADPDAVPRVPVAGRSPDLGLAPLGRDEAGFPHRRLHGHGPGDPGGYSQERVPGKHETTPKLSRHGHPDRSFQGGRSLGGDKQMLKKKKNPFFKYFSNQAADMKTDGFAAVAINLE